MPETKLKPRVIRLVRSQVPETKPEVAVVKEVKKGKPMELKAKVVHSPRRTLLLLAGIVAVGLAVFIGMMWMNNQRNPFFAVIAVGSGVAGIYLLYTQLKPAESRVVVVPGEISGKRVKIGKVNSLNIYAKKDSFTNKIFPEKVAFEWIDEPLGQPQQCINTGKSYYVHIWDIDKTQLIPFILPDTKYTDPARMARYIELPAQRKYLKHRDSLMKYIGPGILALMVGGGFIALIALAG